MSTVEASDALLLARANAAAAISQLYLLGDVDADRLALMLALVGINTDVERRHYIAALDLLRRA